MNVSRPGSMDSDIKCPLFGSIILSKEALQLINTPEFQRLKNITRTGACRYIYPNLGYSQFEHSVGIYHLTGICLNYLFSIYPKKKYHIPEISKFKMKLTGKIIELIKIAGLCYNLGCGPFGHLFDQEILKGINHPHRYHKMRSCLIFKMICKNIFIQSEINFITSIMFKTNQTNPLFQIVFNESTEMDMITFDYLIRDVYYLGLPINFDLFKIIDNIHIRDNKIMYHQKCIEEIYALGKTHFFLHKHIYRSTVVKMIETALVDHIQNDLLIPTLNDMIKFCQLTDIDFNLSGLFVKNNYMFIINETNIIDGAIQSLTIFTKMKKFIEMYSENNNIPENSFKMIKVWIGKPKFLKSIYYFTPRPEPVQIEYMSLHKEERYILLCTRQDHYCSASTEWMIYNHLCKI